MIERTIKMTDIVLCAICRKPLHCVGVIEEISEKTGQPIGVLNETPIICNRCTSSNTYKTEYMRKNKPHIAVNQ